MPSAARTRLSLSVAIAEIPMDLLRCEGTAMGLNWPGVFMGVNELPEPEQKICEAVVDEFGDTLKAELASCGLPTHASPFFRQLSLIAVRDNSKILVAISPATGMPQVSWLDRPNDRYPLLAMVDLLQNQRGGRLRRWCRCLYPGAHSDLPSRSESQQSAHAKWRRGIVSASSVISGMFDTLKTISAAFSKITQSRSATSSS